MHSLKLPYVMVYRAERYSTTNGPFQAASLHRCLMPNRIVGITFECDR
jgi:hypothetical protein